MSTDTVVGKMKEVGGEARSKLADVTGDSKGKVLGEKDKLEGKIQKNYGKAKDAIKDALDD